MPASPEPTPGGPAAEAPTLLVVGDPAPVGAAVGRHGWRAVFVRSAADAFDRFDRATPQAVLIDVRGAGPDAVAFAGQVRERCPRIPVVLTTREGGEDFTYCPPGGAIGFVPWRELAAHLPAVLDQALADARAAGLRTRALGCLSRRVSRFVLDNDPALVGPVVAILREELETLGVCEAGAAARVGIALEEALLNAVYHGNLGVSSDLKRADDAAFHRLAAERRGAAPYRDRRVRLTARLSPAAATFEVADDGLGFDPASLPDPTAGCNVGRPCGRGLLLMRAFVDEVSYNRAGTRVRLVKRRV